MTPFAFQLKPLARTAALAAMLLVSACMSPPANLDTSLDRPTAEGRYRIRLQPPASAPALNQMHAWEVSVATPDGQPVRQARIAVDGGMPQHGHGLPTKPRVTRELADGRYLIEGMKLSMTGWWEIKLAVQGEQGADKVTFNTVVKGS
ncbi:MAG: FixH family protein [Rhizobacter sp.]|nr:FixH family protein [Rhizobacter sp.]